MQADGQVDRPEIDPLIEYQINHDQYHGGDTE